MPIVGVQLVLFFFPLKSELKKQEAKNKQANKKNPEKLELKRSIYFFQHDEVVPSFLLKGECSEMKKA